MQSTLRFVFSDASFLGNVFENLGFGWTKMEWRTEICIFKCIHGNVHLTSYEIDCFRTNFKSNDFYIDIDKNHVHETCVRKVIKYTPLSWSLYSFFISDCEAETLESFSLSY